MAFDIQHAVDSGADNSAAVVSISGVTRQIILDALFTYTESYTWYPAPTDTDSVMNALDTAFDEVMTNVQTMPIGTILPFAGALTDIPTGWLHCNGAGINTELFPALFALIGYRFGGSGALYHVPETRNTFLRGGYENGGGTGGQSSVTLTSNNLPAHKHSVSSSTGLPLYTFTGAGGGRNGIGLVAGLSTNTNRLYVDNNTTANTPVSINPPFVDILYIIYAGDRE